MVLYELATRHLPFYEYAEDHRFSKVIQDGNGQSFRVLVEMQIREGIIKQNLRPTIPIYIPKPLSSLMEKCWQKEPALRPSFDQIVETLTEIVNIHCNVQNSNAQSPNNLNEPPIVNLHTYLHPKRFTHAPTTFNQMLPPAVVEEQVKQDSDKSVFKYSYSISLPPNCNPLCLTVCCGNIWCGCDTGDILIWDSHVFLFFSPPSFYFFLRKSDKRV